MSGSSFGILFESYFDDPEPLKRKPESQEPVTHSPFRLKLDVEEQPPEPRRVTIPHNLSRLLSAEIVDQKHQFESYLMLIAPQLGVSTLEDMYGKVLSQDLIDRPQDFSAFIEDFMISLEQGYRYFNEQHAYEKLSQQEFSKKAILMYIEKCKEIAEIKKKIEIQCECEDEEGNTFTYKQQNREEKIELVWNSPYITILPREIEELTPLIKLLDLGYTSIISYPLVIQNMHNLESLFFHESGLLHLPDDFILDSQTKLKEVSFYKTRLQTLPNFTVFNEYPNDLGVTRRIDMGGTKMTTIPLAQLTAFKSVELIDAQGHVARINFPEKFD